MLTNHKRLTLVREDLGDCRRCGLCETRANIVFGTGSANTPLMFVGEGPGQDEDLAGEPFVGRAGKLLDKMIAAIGYTRETVYIANIVKCRPVTPDGQNRVARPEEVTECVGFLRAQIAAIQPTVIITLGNLATQTLLGTTDGISRIRGHWQKYLPGPVPVMPTFHPAFLLRTPTGKPYAWRDLKSVAMALARAGFEAPLTSRVPEKRSARAV